jgi:hypothetical protein
MRVIEAQLLVLSAYVFQGRILRAAINGLNHAEVCIDAATAWAGELKLVRCRYSSL